MAEAAYTVVIHRAARSELDAITNMDIYEALCARIRSASRRRYPPDEPKVEPLTDVDLLTVRAGQYRAILTLDKPELRVLLVDKRDRVYDRLGVAERRATEA